MKARSSYLARKGYPMDQMDVIHQYPAAPLDCYLTNDYAAHATRPSMVKNVCYQLDGEGHAVEGALRHGGNELCETAETYGESGVGEVQVEVSEAVGQGHQGPPDDAEEESTRAPHTASPMGQQRFAANGAPQPAPTHPVPEWRDASNPPKWPRAGGSSGQWKQRPRRAERERWKGDRSEPTQRRY